MATPSSCPICTESVPPTATECPNCGAALTVEQPPPFVIEEKMEVAEESVASEVTIEAEPPPVKPARSKKVSSPVRKKAEKKKPEPSRESVKILSHGYPFDPSLPFVCPLCGYGFHDLEQDVCPACQSAVAKEKAAIEKEIHQTRVDDFVSTFDREEGLDESVLAYLYRKQVKPALLERYEPVAQKWTELFAQGSVSIPGGNADTKPNLDRLLGASQAMFRLARLWVSAEVTRYAVLPEARLEINECLRDLLCRAYQIQGQYHSWRGARGTDYRGMESAYEQSQRMYRKAADLQSKLSPETQSLNQSAIELLRMALSYPEKYQKAGKGKNLITAEGAPGYEQDKQTYEAYLTAYSSLEKRVEDCREHLKLAQKNFQENIRKLDKRVEDLEEEKTKKAEAIEQESKDIAQEHALAVRDLPGRKASAQTWAMWMPVIIGLASVGVLFASDLTALTAFGVGLGAVVFSYFHGFSKETFHGQVLPGVQIMKWIGVLLLLAGLFPLFEEWMSIAF